ncbi:MAG TPA: hypothetical protein VG432_03255, partial [Gemmatimonadaceae bacterium]|nr:hypothetical protein [Gemmatimonadaceae bacterium]
MRARGGSAVIAAALVAVSAIARAQSPVYIPIDDPASQLVDALVARGALPSLGALERPHLAGAVRDAVDSALARADRGASPLTA